MRRGAVVASMPIRVAMIIQRYAPFVGGAERQLEAIVRHLPAHGVEPLIITRQYSSHPDHEVVDGTRVWRISNPGPRILAAVGFTINAVRRLRVERPDIVHAHELLSPTTTALAAKRLLGAPVVAKVLRGGALGDIEVLRRNGRVGKLRLSAICRGVDAFTVVSGEIDAELESLGVGSERRVFAPNGVDLDRFRPATEVEKVADRQRLGLPGGPLALFAGRFEPEKQLEQLVTLWPRVREKVPGALLLLIGQGSQSEKLRQSAGEGVRVLDPQADIELWYRLADVFVLPSKAEGLSNSLLEAMASGLVCVVTGVGAAPELIGKDERGILAPTAPPAIVEPLASALSGSDAMKQRAREARRYVAEHYSLDATVERLANLYRSLAAGKGTAPSRVDPRSYAVRSSSTRPR